MSNLPNFVGTSIKNQVAHVGTIYKKVLESKEFEILKNEFFPNETLDVNQAFVLESTEPDHRQFDAEGIVLVSKNGKIAVTFIEGKRDQEPFKAVNALTITQVEGSDVISSFEVNDDEELVFMAENFFEGELRKEFNEALETPLFPETHDEVESQVQGFAKGCLWGGYRWCGEACNNYPSMGGDGSTINSTDDCCKIHDYCYLRKEISKSRCDANFCTCLYGKTTTAAALARAWFC